MEAIEYVKKFDILNFDPNKLKSLRLDLEFDYKQEIKQAKDRKDKILIINRLIQKLIYLYNVSNRKIDVDAIWKNMYVSVIFVGHLEEFKFKTKEGNIDLFYFFQWFKHQNNKSVKPIVKVENQFEDYLNFTGLHVGSSKTELLKRFLELCLIHHPDKGGRAENFIKLKMAKQYLNEKLK